jgi:2-hydroxymuconate-semialdehyde hydrolase
MSRRRQVLVRVIVPLAILCALWTVLAGRAGMFIPHDERLAVQPGAYSRDAMSTAKRLLSIDGRQIAYIDLGVGEPVILLHGCPFSVYEWRDVAPSFAKHFRVIAPDLVGLGDTPVRLNEDYRLPENMRMVQALMDRLGVKSARFIGHDHGGAIVQLLMQYDPGRVDMAILTNVEAYDQWPSEPEIPDLKLITNPVTSPLIFHAFQFRAVQRELYSIAVVDRATLTDETLEGFTRSHLTSALRWQRLRRFFVWQLDPEHNRLTQEAVPAMRRFEKPVLILWGQQDTNFGVQIAKRLAADIPGVVGLHWMTQSAHLPMLEESEAYSATALDFLLYARTTESAKRALHEARRQFPSSRMESTAKRQPVQSL